MATVTKYVLLAAMIQYLMIAEPAYSVTTFDVPFMTEIQMPIGNELRGKLEKLSSADTFSTFNYPKIRFNENSNSIAENNEWYVSVAHNSNRYLDKGWNQEPSESDASYYVDYGLPTGADYHPGEDWNLCTGGDSDDGEQVYPIGKGIVLFKGTKYGNTLIIVHKTLSGEFVTSFYGHLKEFADINEGQAVNTSNPIGTIGKSGCDGCGAHLHFEVRKKSLLNIDNASQVITLNSLAIKWPGTIAGNIDNGKSFIEANYYNPSLFINNYNKSIKISWFYNRGDNEGWMLNNAIHLINNGLLEMSPSSDPQIISPHLQLNPSDVDKLQIYGRNNSQNSSGNIFITSDKIAKFNDGNSLPILFPNDNRWHLIQIDVHKIPGWDAAGKITGIRIDPIANGNGTSDKIYIDYIRLRKNVQNTADSLIRWHPDGTLVKVANNSNVYFLEKGKKRLIPDEATFLANNFDWLNIITISDAELNGYSLGTSMVMPNDRVIKRAGSFPKCYLASEPSKKRWIKSEEAFSSLGFNFAAVESIAEAEFAAFSEGPDVTSIYPEGTLIKEKGKPDVYVISNGEPKPFASQAAFQKLGYFAGDNDGDGIWDSIVEVNKLPGMPSLEPIKESQIYQAGNPGNPKVTMTWPLGGEKVIGNTLRTVTYKIENAVNVAKVGISFTVDKFKEILRFATDAPKNSEYTWQIPDVVSDGASVEITAYDYDGRPYSTSPETYLQIEKSDSASQDYFDIYNDGGVPLEIKGITVDTTSTWLKLSNPPTYPFSITPNSSTRIKIAVEKAGLSSGIYTGNVSVESNDPSTPVIPVEVRLTINSDNIAPLAPAPINVTPTGWSQNNSVAIDWTNPDDPSGIVGGYYKIGSPPQSNLDGTYFDISQKPLQLPVFSDGRYTAYIWLKDSVGNIDYTKNGFVEFQHDSTPPALTSKYPENGDVNIYSDTTVSAALIDEYSGVDPTTVVMKVNGTAVTPVVTDNANAIALSYKPASPLQLGETVEVSLVANDKSVPPNQMPLNTWSFTVTLANDTTAPVINAFAVPPTSTSITVTGIMLTASDIIDVTGYMLTETSIPPLPSASGWSSNVPTQYTFTTPGNKTLYAWAKDAAGNVSASRSSVVTIDASAFAPMPPQGIPERFIGVYLPVSPIYGQSQIDYVQSTATVAKNYGVDAINLIVHWDDIQTAGNTYDFESLTKLIYTIKAKGLRCILRIFFNAGDSHEVVPEFLKDSITNHYYAGGKFQPLPWDLSYQSHMANLLTELSAYFKVSQISPDSIQISGGGDYGEQVLTNYTSPLASDLYWEQLITAEKLHVNKYHMSFPEFAADTILMINSLVPDNSEKNKSLVTYAQDTNASFHWVQSNAGVCRLRDAIYGPENIALLKSLSGVSIVLEDESSSSNCPDGQRSVSKRYDIIKQLEVANGIKFKAITLNGNDLVEANRDGINALLSHFDAVAPAVTEFSMPSTSNSLTIAGISLAATDNVAVSGYLLTESTVPPAASAAGWSLQAPTSYTFGSQGSRTLCAWAKDAAGNVSLSMSAAIAITLSQTITGFSPPTSKTYGDAAITLTATGGASGNPVTFSVVSGPGSASGTNNAILTITGAGTIVVKASQAGNSNYAAAPDVQKSIIVSPKALTITAGNASRAYGVANPANPGFTAPGLVGTDSIGTVTYSYAATATTIANVGTTHSITPSSAAFTSGLAGNYTITYATGTLTIGIASQAITGFVPPTSKTYGDVALTLTATGGPSGNPIAYSMVSGPGNVSGINNATLTITGAGTIVVKASQAGNSNYAAAPDVTASITVSPKALTVTANNASRAYGDPNPLTPGFTAPALVGSDTIGSVTYAYAATATATAPSGTTHSITPSSAVFTSGSAANYNITYLAGTLTIGGTAAVWQQTALIETGAMSLAIDPITPQVVYAGTSAGVFRTINGGGSWSAANSGLTSIYVSSFAIDTTTPQTIYAAGTYGGVFKSFNGGGSWSASNTGLTDADHFTLAIDPFTPSTIYVGAYSGGVYKSINGGAGWNGLNTADVWSLAVAPSASQVIYAGTSQGVFKSVNGGASWSEVSTGLTAAYVPCLAVDPFTPETVYAGTDEGVFKSINGGASWNGVNTGLTDTYVNSLVIDPTNAQSVYAGTNAGGVFKSVNGGTSWSEFNAGLTNLHIQSLAIDPSNTQTVYAGTASGVFKTVPGSSATLTVSKSGTGIGTVTSSPGGISCGDACSASFTTNAVVTLTAAAAGGSTFAGWSGACSGTGTCTVTMNATKNVGAVFNLPENGVCGTANGGSFTSSPTTNLCSKGTSSEVSKFYFSGGCDPITGICSDCFGECDTWRWTCTGSNGGTPANCSAYIQTFTVNASVIGGNGTISCTGPVEYNATSTCTITPATGYQLATLTDNGVDKKSAVSGNSYIINNVTADHSITATFTSQTASAEIWQKTGNLNGPVETVGAIVVDPTAPQTIYAGTTIGVFKTTNGGGNWSAVNTGLTTLDVRALAFDSKNQTVYAGSYGGGIFKSVNGGESWSAINNGLTDTGGYSIRGLVIDPVNPQIVYAGSGGGVFKTTNGGNSWSSINTGLTNLNVTSLVIDPVAPQNVYVGINSGTISGTETGGVFKSTNSGGSWSPVNSGLTTRHVLSLAIDTKSPEIIYAGTSTMSGGTGGVFKSANGGIVWSAVNTGLTSKNINTIAIDPTISDTIVVGTYWGIFKSVNGGTGWSAVDSGLTTPYVASLAIDPTATQTLYAGTFEWGGMFKSVNGGTDWNSANKGLTKTNVTSLAIDPITSQTVYAATDGNGIYRSVNGGSSWTAVNIGLTTPWTMSLAIDRNTTQTVYAGVWGGVDKTLDSGTNWSAARSGLNDGDLFYLAIDPTNSQTLYVGVVSGGVYKSTDGGTNWTAVNNGLASNNVDALAIHPTSPTTIYAGTWDKGIFKSNNGGGSWSPVNTGLTTNDVRSVIITPISLALYAGTRGGGVFKSTNGGTSWSAVNSGLTNLNIWTLAVDPTNSQIIYAGTEGGGVFKSSNGGTSWSEFNSGLTNKNVQFLAIDPLNPQIVYAGTNGGGVFKTVPVSSATLTVSKSGTGSGSVSSAPAGISCGAACNASFTTNAVVTLTATAAAGSNFAGWSGACSGTGTCTVTMNATKNVGAVFNLTENGACGTANGTTVSTKPSTNLCTTGTASAVAGTGPWSWTCSGSNGGTNASCSAQLASQGDKTLTITKSGTGTGNFSFTGGKSFSQSGNIASVIYAYGKVANVTAIPTNDSTFGSWTGCDSVNGTTCTITMNTNKSVSLTLNPPPSNGTCGSASGNTFTAAPQLNLCSSGTPSAISGTGHPWNWSCSGANGGTTANCSATIQAYTVTFTPGTGGAALTGTISQTIDHGNSTTSVMATPLPEFHFVSWTGTNGFAATHTNPLVINNVTTIMAITANFAPDPVNGSCGNANGKALTAAPSGADLCSAGNASAVTGSGPFNWDCAGLHGGSNASCSASLLDVAGPTLNVSTLANGAITNNATLNVSGTVTDQTGVASVTVNDVLTTVTNGSFTTAITLDEGNNTVTVAATDTVGNSTIDTRTIIFDMVPAELTVSAPADNSTTAQPLVTVNGTVSETSTVTVTLGNGTPHNAALTGSAYSATVALVNGINTITIKATDLAGNSSSAVRTIIHDITKPSLAVTIPVQDNTVSQNTLTLHGTVSDTQSSVTVSITMDDQTFTPSVSDGKFQQQLTFTSAKQYAIVVTAIDAAGNSSAVQRNVIYAPPAATGDLNGDHAIDVFDALLTLQYALNIIPHDTVNNEKYMAVADVYPLDENQKPKGDGKVDVMDALLILQRAVGLLSW